MAYTASNKTESNGTQECTDCASDDDSGLREWLSGAADTAKQVADLFRPFSELLTAVVQAVTVLTLVREL
jgi:hypothetical protein